MWKRVVGFRHPDCQCLCHPPSSSLVSPQTILSQQHQLSKPKPSLLDAHRDVLENPRSSLSPLTNSLLEQLEARIKELKVWLRDTELLIFNSCLRDKDAAQQLQCFKVAAALVSVHQNLSGVSSTRGQSDVPPGWSHQDQELLRSDQLH